MNAQLLLWQKKGYKLDVIQSVFGSVGWAVFQIFQIVCLAFTGILALKGNIFSLVILPCIKVIFATIVNQVSAFITLVPTIAKGIESVNSIGEVLLSDDIEKMMERKELHTITGAFDFKMSNFNITTQILMF